ncbi:MAG: RsiV family protein, partial [Eubacteriales bacterium]
KRVADFHRLVIAHAERTIKTNNDNTLVIDIYYVNIVASSSTTHKFFTINKKTKTLVTLPTMFKSGSDYVTILSKYIAAEMKRQNEASEYPLYWDDESAFKKIKENQSFYINKDGKLVICFDKYDVGPGSTGCPEFVIPDEVIKDILK